ncbi:hypothetical protein ACFE04_022582 [Oxalis oulophora]
MAVIRERRQLNLRLPLPDISERHQRFPLPLPPSVTSTTITSSAAANITAADIENINVLGHGNGGTVYKVKHKKTSEIYALKVVQADGDATVRRQVFREIEILRRTDSPYVVQCHGVYEKPSGDIAILLEYMDAGSLDTILKTSGTFSESTLSLVASQILKGLSYLHAHKIIHRDIKPSNLLVNEKMEIKIADFGVSKIMCRTLDACNSYVGTCAYMSPERFDPDSNGGNYNGYSGDIWSLGLTLLELYVGHFPFLPPGQKPDWSTLMCAICFGDPPALPEEASTEFKSFVQCCLQKDSNKRWSVSQLLNHPFQTKSPELCGHGVAISNQVTGLSLLASVKQRESPSIIGNSGGSSQFIGRVDPGPAITRRASHLWPETIGFSEVRPVNDPVGYRRHEGSSVSCFNRDFVGNVGSTEVDPLRHPVGDVGLDLPNGDLDPDQALLPLATSSIPRHVDIKWVRHPTGFVTLIRLHLVIPYSSPAFSFGVLDPMFVSTCFDPDLRPRWSRKPSAHGHPDRDLASSTSALSISDTDFW